MLRTLLPILLTALLITASAWASETYTPPEGGDVWQRATVYLKGAAPYRAATGAAVFACNMAETQHRGQIYARGLRPETVHTIWIVSVSNGRVTSGYQVTSRIRPIRTDHRGVLYFIGNLPSCPMGRDQVLVKYHPVAANRNFRDGITVLVGRLADMK